MTQQRKIWVDWAKVLGMYTIIYGHCFPETMSNFIYAFNVPVFFIISGYLCKKEQDFSTCWNKTLRNLIIPYYILAFIKVAGAIFKHLDDGQWMWSMLAVLGGFHTLNDAAGCSNLWFVYSLIIIKLVYQIAGKKTNLLLCILCLAGTWIYNQYLNIELRWAVADCMLAFPFFLLGRFISQKEYLQKTCRQLCHLSWGGQMDAGKLYAIPIRRDLFNRRTERTGQNVHESLWQQPHLVCDSCHYRKYSCYFYFFPNGQGRL